MVLRNGPNITHGAKNFRDVPGDRREPDFPLGKLISSASNSGGSNVPHMLWGGWLMQVKETNPTDVQLAMNNLQYISGHAMDVIGWQFEIHHLH